MHTKFWSGNPEEREHLEGQGVDGRMLKKDLREKRWEGVGFIHLSQDINHLQALVNTVMNFWVL
jgi:hypothetical protein